MRPLADVSRFPAAHIGAAGGAVGTLIGVGVTVWLANLVDKRRHRRSMSGGGVTRQKEQPGRPDAYFTLGFEYYVAGRHAADCGYVQVAAHLFHFAVELILKSQLLGPAYERAMGNFTAARAELEAECGPDAKLDPDTAAACLEPHILRADQLEHEFGHSLPRLWAAFKAQVDGSLTRFDGLITRLHRWEDIRYPAFAGGQGNAISYNPRGPRNRMRTRRSEPVNTYYLIRDEVDELVAALIGAVRFNPNLIPVRAQRRPGGPGLDTYRRDNRHVLGPAAE
jgi:hypothetical protein